MNPRKLIMTGLSMIAVTYGFARFGYGLMFKYNPNKGQSLAKRDVFHFWIDPFIYLEGRV